MKQVFCCALLIFASCTVTLAQTYNVLWSFGGSPTDGSQPYQGLISDKAGNLYGTTFAGGNSTANCPPYSIGCGTVFQLSLSKGTWSETLLYQFCVNGSPNNCPDGSGPMGQLVSDSSGNLYGATGFGGIYNGGTVFELSPPSIPGNPWTEQVLWSFCAQGLPCPDGAGPNSPLVMDSAGNLYGTAGGGLGYGTVFEVKPSSSGATESVLYSFGTNFDEDGYTPRSGVIFDSSGNLYGTTQYSFPFDTTGTVYELSPGLSGPWSETVLHTFGQKNAELYTEVSFDAKGDLYGFTTCSRAGCNLGGGALFRLAPFGTGKWGILFLTMPSSVGDPATNPLIVNETLYGGNSEGGGNNGGTIFEVRGATQTTLYNFCSQPNCADGREPYLGGSLLLLGRKLYGTTVGGGASGQGVVFQIAP